MASAAAAAGVSRIGLSPRAKRVLFVALFAITVLAVLVIGVFPTQQYLEQRAEVSARREELRELQAENAALAAQVAALQTDDEIERIARSEYNLVKPGEEAYVVLPPPDTGRRVPPVWPFDR
ncbi:MAG TPA: septum formation initiator family protein [Acidimicrobiales bacterium]